MLLGHSLQESELLTKAHKLITPMPRSKTECGSVMQGERTSIHDLSETCWSHLHVSVRVHKYLLCCRRLQRWCSHWHHRNRRPWSRAWGTHWWIERAPLCLSSHCPWILNSWLLICKVWLLTDTQQMRGSWSKVQCRSTCCCLIWWPASHTGGA